MDVRQARTDPFAGDWEEAVFEKMREHAHHSRMTLSDAFAQFCGKGVKIMGRDQLHKAIRGADEELNDWQLDHISRFFSSSQTTITVGIKDWLKRLEPESRTAAWSESMFQMVRPRSRWCSHPNGSIAEPPGLVCR